MKKIIVYHISLLLLMYMAGGCYKDNGNYDYHAINQLSLADTNHRTAINVNFEDTLRLEPQIGQSLTKDESGLSFEWSVYNTSPDQPANAPITILSRERNLAVKVVYPFTLGGQFNVLYKVTDQATNVSSYFTYVVRVVNKFSQGYVVMEEVEGGSDFSMILLNGEVVKNIYSGLNGAPLPGKPRSIYLTTFPIFDDVSVGSKKMYMLTENGGIELDYVTLSRRFGLEALFYKAPPALDPSHMKWYVGNVGFLINNGKLNINLIGGFPGAKKFGETLLTPTGDLNYQLAPFSTGGNTVYDNLGKRFYSVAGSGTTLNTFPAQASTLFDMNNLGMDMLYMSESSITTEGDVLVKDAGGTVYYLRIKTNTTTASPVATLKMEPLTNSPGIDRLAAASSSVVSPHLFYGSDNKVYRYETTSNTTQLQYTFPDNEKIVLMKCPLPFLGYPQLVVVTRNGTESKVYFFEISVTGSISTYNGVYGGFGKIVDLDMKS